MKLFYISFATDTEFLGATVLESHDEFSVLAEASKHGLNQGGQAAILEIPYAALDAPDIRMMQGKLLNKKEMIANGAVRYGDIEAVMQNKIENVAFVIGD